MKIDDQMMTVLTGLVVAVVLGTLIQETSTISRLIFGTEEIAAKDDVLFVRAEGPQALDVTANDGGISDQTSLKVLAGPACGAVAAKGNTLTYTPQEGCEGELRLTYCIDDGTDCAKARVSLTVHKTEDQRRGFATARAATVDAAPRPAPAPAADASTGAVPVPGEPGLQVVSKEPAPISGLVVSLDVPRAEDARAARRSDPYLQALSGLIAWSPGEEALPDSPVALLLASAQIAGAPDPKATKMFLWSHVKAEEPARTARLPKTVRSDKTSLAAADITTLTASLDAPAMPEFPLARPAAPSAPMLPQLAPTASDVAAPKPEAPPASADSECSLEAIVSPAFGARLEVLVIAPCLAGEPIVLSHGGLDFVDTLSSTGRAKTRFPALAADGRVELRSGGKLLTEAGAEVDGLDEVNRFAVLLPEKENASLIATERNRSTGLVREVTLRSFITHQDAIGLGRGYIRAFPSIGGKRVEVYTLPVSDRASLPEVTLKVRRQTAEGCGAPLKAGIADAGIVLTRILDMPACGEAQIASVGAIGAK